MNWNVHDSEQEMRKYMSDREWDQFQANKEKVAEKKSENTWQEDH